MIADHTLAQIVRGLIGRCSEGVYWDFKLEHHSNTGDLIHDVLCLANAEHDGPRFLVFGVEDGGASVQSIEDDDGRRTQADIAGLFRDNAGKFFQSRFPTFHFPEFTLKAASAEGDGLDSSQEWTRGENRTDNNHAGWYELRCHQTLLRRIHYVSFDNHKKSVVAPDWRAIGRGRFYFYQADSIRYAVQRFWTALQRRDDSKGLLARGEGESATEARSRWRRGLDIPVLNPGELEGFLEGRQGNAIGANNPATDPAEQYELFLHNLLDFDDWRRAQTA